MKLNKLTAAVAAGVMLLAGPATMASANTAPNAWSPQGESWISVAESSKVYFESFGSSYDDYGIYYVGEGITCTYNSITATGPFLTGQNLSSSECVDDQNTAFDPIDNATRLGSSPFGFNVNFYGTTYTSAWPNTNGGLYFDAPDNSYDALLGALAADAQSSAIFPLAGDLYYEPTESNMWVAQTTIEGHDAVVFSWEKFHNCCNSGATEENMSFQLVLIDAGNGDFNAMFNYDAFDAFDQGYQAPAVMIDIASGTVGSNVFEVLSLDNVPNTCMEVYVENSYGTVTDSQLDSDLNSTAYFKIDDAADSTISLWTDDTCTTALNMNVAQDTANDLMAYWEIEDDNSTYNAIGAGWSTYNQTTGEVSATEMLQNIDADTMIDGASDPLIEMSWNTDVPGRFVMGQRGGSTVTEQSELGGIGTGEATEEETAEPELAATGAQDVAPLGLGAITLIAGGVVLMVRRRVMSL